MIIGVPKELKDGETRVSLIPSSVKTLIDNKNVVHVEKGAGEKVGFTDEEYVEAGAKIVDSTAEIYSKSEIVVKIKEVQKEEYGLLKQGQTIISFLRMALYPELLTVFLKKKITAISYETIQLPDDTYPVLTPMSEISGKLAVQIAANLLESSYGKGRLIGGLPGVHPSKVLIIGGGVSGMNAAKVAIGMGAEVVVIDISPAKLTKIDDMFCGRVKTAVSNDHNLKKYIKKADVVIGAVLTPSAKLPQIITEEMVKTMQKGSVIVDISIDQGGIFEGFNEPQSFENPVVEKHGIYYYASSNMASRVGRTGSISLNNYTLPYILKLADKGIIATVKSTPELYKGVNTYQGKLTNEQIAASLKQPHSELSMLIGF